MIFLITDFLIGLFLAILGITAGLKGYTVLSIIFSLGSILTAVWIITISRRK